MIFYIYDVILSPILVAILKNQKHHQMPGKALQPDPSISVES